METKRSEAGAAREAVCWCGRRDLADYSPEYALCRACGTLVSRVGLTAEEVVVRDDADDFYGKDYWLGHQVEDLGNPDIFRRARADLPERCLHWLRTVLCYKLPPGRVLELGCAHGGFVAMLRSAGFDGLGLEMSPWVADFARQTFGVPMLQGPIEEQDLPEQSFDALVLNDVVEHLVDPLATLGHCARLLRPDGIFVVQMPSYPDGVGYEELRARKDRFLEHMDGKAEQHLNLFSPRASRLLFERLGFAAVDFVPAIFDYDQYLIACRQPLVRHDAAARAKALTATPGGRLTLALIDLIERHEVCEADRAERLKVILQLDEARRAGDADRAAQRQVIDQLQAALRAVEADRLARHEEVRNLRARLESSEADRAARLQVIRALEEALRSSEADREARLEVIRALEEALRASEADRAARLEVIHRLDEALRNGAADRAARGEEADAPPAQPEAVPPGGHPRLWRPWPASLLRSVRRLLRAG